MNVYVIRSERLQSFASARKAIERMLEAEWEDMVVDIIDGTTREQGLTNYREVPFMIENIKMFITILEKDSILEITSGYDGMSIEKCKVN